MSQMSDSTNQFPPIMEAGVKSPLISICIPAYKRVDFLKRLLDSIAIQHFKDFEVVISDDSPATEVAEMLQDYAKSIPNLIYHRNEQALGTPANWNKAIEMAKGQWIKIMHDDDWFTSPDGIQKFATAVSKGSPALVFCSYKDVFLETGKEKKVRPPAYRFRQMVKEPATLLSRNIIGPPSVTMHRKDGKHTYDTKLKWLVDIDMYIRRMKDEPVSFLPDFLVNVGVGKDQVTASVHGAGEVEIPEHFHFLSKSGIGKLKHILVYDYWWRLFRNFNIHSEADIRGFGYAGPIHAVFISMISWQNRILDRILRIGVFSKIFMFVHFILHRRKLIE